MCKQKRVVRVKDHKSVLSCFHVKIDLTDEQMEEAEPEMSAKEIRAIRKPPEVEIIAPAQQIDDQSPGQDSIDRHP